METWRKDARREAIIVDLEALVPKDHLLRKIEKVMDHERLYERLEPYYCHDNGRPGTDPVVLIKKEQVAKAAKVYSGQLRREVNAEREKLGKKPIEEEDDENHPQGGGGRNSRKDGFHHGPGLRNVRKRRA